MRFFVQYRLSAIIKQFSVSDEATAFYYFHKHRHAAEKKINLLKLDFIGHLALYEVKLLIFNI